MKYSLTKQLKQTQVFHTKLYDSLEYLRLSNGDLLQNLLKIIQENPLLDLDFKGYDCLSFDESLGHVYQKRELKAYLYYQLNTNKGEINQIICEYIIESLDERGFFHENIEECCLLLGVDENEFKIHLKIIQDLDPLGVGANSIVDALIIQCEKDKRVLARRILEECYHELLEDKKSKIAKKLNVKTSQVIKEIEYLKTLNPFPCFEYSTNESTIKIPEIKIVVEDQQILISPMQSYTITFNDIYLDLLNEHPAIKNYLEEAKTILANMDKRNVTLMLVMNELVKAQQGYFLYGDELNACNQYELANRLGIHPSTVSRAIKDKYYEFNDTIYELKDLFVSSTQSGESSDAIKKALLQVIHKEDKNSPFSDEALVDQLKVFNLDVSRRTISKYRTSLKIENCRKRKL